MSSAEEINITVLKFKDLFTIRSKDIDRVHWFSMPIDLLTHPDFFDVSGDEFKVFVWIVSVAAKCKSDTIRLNIDHAARLLNVRKLDIESALKKLQGKQLDVAFRPPSGRREAPARPLHNITEQNITLQNTIAQTSLSVSDFEQLYKKYPRKEGKQRGFAKLKVQLKCEKDLLDFGRAMENYEKFLKEKKTEARFIKQFSTFVSEWRDWLDSDAGAVVGFGTRRGIDYDDI